MAKALVIVESPAKARTINKFLGEDFTVCASGGHIMDLPKRKMGVDVEHGFQPEYIIIPARKKIISQLKKEAKGKESIYLAADPDREGEAICWHLQKNLNTGAAIYRVIFHEITESAVQEAFVHPGSIDMHKVQAQQARRILDRLVGYSLSPLLWKKISRGLSAGRVQSVAVRIIVEREREIGHFVPQEYWELEAQLKKKLASEEFCAKLDKIDGNKPEIKNKDQADKIVERLRKENFVVSDIQQKEKKRNPQGPYTTSKLQQDAFNQLHFPAGKTMRIAQQLYEGLELGKEGSVGLITYMRTDSVRVSQTALQAARDYIASTFGKEYLPAKPAQYKSKKLAQEAHEAIRPALPLRPPEKINEYLNSDQYKLYSLIWNKFITSQMKPAIYLINTILITAGNCLFKATGSSLKFVGFLKVGDLASNSSSSEEKKQVLPLVQKGEELTLIKLAALQHFTQPPPRFSDASLVKILEEKGIGRPSTYAPIIQTIIYRDYVRRNKGYFFPTELGFTVTDMLTQYFPKILDVKFTAMLEEELDEVEEGKLDWVKVVEFFYQPFTKELVVAQKKVKKEEVPTREICQLCGRPMVIKWGRRGRFLSCSGFPECKNARSITTEIRCPQAECQGYLVERRTKRGRIFYGCSNYPQCTYTANQLPEAATEQQPTINGKEDEQIH
ncbi:MAG: type I DNA topoisomerase [Candidatus Omnitrophica bacterium]|nr:type I DNA topoisomerase [Candidatus Omnitrophota bacterium]